MELIPVALFVFHLVKLGKKDNEKQPSNIELILFTLLVFQLDISGKSYETLKKYQ